LEVYPCKTGLEISHTPVQYVYKYAWFLHRNKEVAASESEPDTFIDRM